MTENKSQTPSHPLDPAMEPTALPQTGYPVGMSETMAEASSQPNTPPDRTGGQPQPDSAIHMTETTVETLREPSTPCPKSNTSPQVDFSADIDAIMTETSSLPSTPEKKHERTPRSDLPLRKSGSSESTLNQPSTLGGVARRLFGRKFSDRMADSMTEISTKPSTPGIKTSTASQPNLPICTNKAMAESSNDPPTPRIMTNWASELHVPANVPSQDGLEWEEGVFSSHPKWTKEPDIKIVKRLAQEYLSCGTTTPIEVTFYAQGGFNKLYRISVAGANYIMRISLPVDPHYKTESEVATISFVRKETDIPVPRIIAFDSDNQNDLKFEWILMDMMPGVPLRKKWRSMSWEAKERLVQQLARYQAQLFEKHFEGIGNLFFSSSRRTNHRAKYHTGRPEETGVPARKEHTSTETETMESPTNTPTNSAKYPMKTDAPLTILQDVKGHPSASTFQLGRIVSMIFFWDDHLSHDVPRGPFRTSYEWLRTRLQFVLRDEHSILQELRDDEDPDEDDIEESELSIAVVEKMLRALPSIFPPNIVDPEPSVLLHNDISTGNILVDEHGEITAIIDWECVSTVPLFRACQFPQLLQGRVREEEPIRNTYGPATDIEEEKPEYLSEGGNEGMNDMYWDHLLEYEQTLLRKLYMEEMEKLKPEWVAKAKSSTLQADFEHAIQNAPWPFRVTIHNTWVEALLDGRFERLPSSWKAHC